MKVYTPQTIGSIGCALSHLKVYNDIIYIFEYAENYLDRDFLDVQVQNMGYNGKNLVLFDL